ncbi:hypothetical protein bcgnr5379_41640 [Bacillus cereus]
MNNQSYEITVDTQKSINHSNIEFSQNNLNISELIFNITEDGKELPLKDTDEIIVYFKKPDKTVVFQDKEIELLDKSKGKIKVLLTTQTLVKAGDVEGEISIGRVDNGMKKRTSTYGFSFKVRSSLASNDSIESTNEFQMFDQLLELGKQDIPALIASKETAEQALEKTEDNANQIGILSQNEKETSRLAQLSMNTLQPSLKKRKTIVTFVSDDGTKEEYTKLKPLFDAKGVRATLAIVPTLIDTTGYLTLTQLKEMYQQGYDIASHTYTHYVMTKDTDETTIRSEFKLSIEKLKEWGFPVESIVYPQGGWNEYTLKIGNEFYLNGVLAGTSKLNYPPINTYQINRVALGSYFDPANEGFTTTNTLDYYKYKVDKAIAENAWLVFMLHPGAYNGNHDATQQQYLSDTIDYIKSKGIEILTLKDAYRRYSNPVDIVDYTPSKPNKKKFRVGADGTVDFTDQDLIITKTKADMNVYVNDTTGDDATGDGSQTKPFKTPNKAIISIPKYIEHIVNVYIEGDYTSQDLSVSGFIGNGTLTVQGNVNKQNIRSINIRSCVPFINVKNFITHGKTDVRDCLNVDVENIDDSDTSARVGIVYYRSNGRVVNSNISNKSVAIQSEYGTLLSNTNTGANNTQALYANWGGKIIKYGTIPAGTQNGSNGGTIV